ncbi:hypothetical protein GCM10010466_51170 [Planomonospora alba]|uniref:Methyltransferase domain-containing protein n=1 Tax=Planomonospora alba TaxID=161354 RepID=A0ABP6NNB7_9ACTN
MRAADHAHATLFGLFHHGGLYDRLVSLGFRPLYRRVAADVASAPLPEGSRVLDVGTGPGRVPLAIAAARPDLRIEGLDLSPGMIDRARRNAARAGTAGRVEFTVGDVADLPHPDGSVDLVVSTMSQHHWPDPAAGMRELSRILRPGGQVWIYDFRVALRRAETAAGPVFPGRLTRREAVRTGRLASGLIGRLVIRPA